MGVFKPAMARQKVTFVTELNSDVFKIVAGGACEVVAILVTAGGSAATFRVLDLPNGGGFTPGSPAPAYNLKDGIAVAVESSNSYGFTPSQPIPYKKGVIIVCEQGEGSNAECTVLLNGN